MMKEVPIKYSNCVALVDDADYDQVSRYTWYLDVSKAGNKYPRALIEGKWVRMHRLLIENIPIIDHIDRNGLNNQRNNLREATKSTNAANARLRTHKTKTSKFKGVYWYAASGVWRAQTKIKGDKIYLGSFLKEEDAAIAYDNKMLELHGEYALTNKELGLL